MWVQEERLRHWSCEGDPGFTPMRKEVWLGGKIGALYWPDDPRIEDLFVERAPGRGPKNERGQRKWMKVPEQLEAIQKCLD